MNRQIIRRRHLPHWDVPDAAYFVQPTADVRGADTMNGESPAFCTNIRLVQIQPNLIRADVRVFWLAYQQGQAGNSMIGANFCADNQAYMDLVGEAYDPTSDVAGTIHSIYVSTTLVRNDQLQ